MNPVKLMVGAAVMILIGAFGKNTDFMVGGLVLMWMAIAQEK